MAMIIKKIAVLLLAAQVSSVESVVSIRNTYPQTHWIPCDDFYRGCYPGFETCYERRHCMLNTWIFLLLVLVGVLACLGLLLIFYYVLFRRGTWMICSLITVSIVAFALTVAVITTIVLHDTQEQEQPGPLARPQQENYEE